MNRFPSHYFDTEFIVLGGYAYCRPFAGMRWDNPLSGLGIGKRMAWLKRVRATGEIEPMKAISLWQPWASLIGRGKWIETRSWGTGYRGPLAIHAAKRWTQDEQIIALKEPFSRALHRAGFDYSFNRGLPFGAIVAVCRLYRCICTNNVLSDVNVQDGGQWVAPFLKINEREERFGNYEPGRVAWVLKDVIHLPEPIPYRGAQGLFEVDLPDLEALLP